jgi:hypothetical protein
MSWPLGDSQAGTLSSSVVRAEANVMLVANSSGELRLVCFLGHFFFLRCRLLRHRAVTKFVHAEPVVDEFCEPSGRPLAAGNSPNDQQGLFPSRNRVGQRLIRKLMGQILLAGEEP